MAYDTILQDSEETRAHFLRRAKASMVSMRAWQYRNPSHPGNGKPDRRRLSESTRGRADAPQATVDAPLLAASY